MASRRNDGPWRAACLLLRGERCRACGSTRWVQVDHIMPRSQGGTSVVENGLPLCEPHHRAKTEARLTIDRAWLDDDQVTWLAAVGWIVFHEDDDPTGRGWRHFTAGGTA